MKKLLVFVFLAISLVANGQNYRKVFFAIDGGAPLGKNSGIGSISLEPSYRINDKMSTGFRIEHNGILSMTGGSNPFLGSLGVSYQYYLPFKPRVFVGGGFAIFNPSNNFLISNTDTQNERNRLGFFPRVGVETFGNAGVPGGFYQSVNKNYFNLKFGFFVGGGRKN